MFQTTWTKGTLVLGTCYSGRNTVRTSCQQQVPASLRAHAYILPDPSSAGSRNRAKIQPLRHTPGPDVHTSLPESLHAYICSANSSIVRFRRLCVAWLMYCELRVRKEREFQEFRWFFILIYGFVEVLGTCGN